MSNFIKYYFEKLDTFDAVFALYYDGEFKKLHILDWDEEGSRSVTNCASDLFFKYIAAELENDHQLQLNWENCEIYLYGTEGIITEYGAEPDFSFQFVSTTDPHLYEPFKNVCAARFAENFDEIFHPKG